MTTVRKFILLFIAILLCFVQASDSTPGPQSAGTSAATPPSGPIPATLFGLHVINGNWPTVSFGVIRSSGVSWPKLEPSRGHFNWAELDKQVSTARRHGATLLWTSNLVPQWAAKDPGTCKPKSGCTSGVANLQDWDDFVTTLATRYKAKIEVYELWNEPDQDFTGPMSDFVPLAQHMHDIVRTIDPGAIIASPAPVSARWADGYFAAGGVKEVDVVTIHGYPTYKPAKPEIIGPQKADPMKAIMAKYGLSGKPLWDTEASWGDSTYGVNDPQEQAGFVARFYLLHWSNGFARFYWYSWDDNGDGPSGVGWGTLFNPNTYTALPAATAYQQVYDWMVGATMNGPCTMAADSTWTCSLTRGAMQSMAIWNPVTTKSYIPPRQYTQYRDLSGNTIQVQGAVTIGSSPILLTTAALPAPGTNVRAITVK